MSVKRLTAFIHHTYIAIKTENNADFTKDLNCICVKRPIQSILNFPLRLLLKSIVVWKWATKLYVWRYLAFWEGASHSQLVTFYLVVHLYEYYLSYCSAGVKLTLYQGLPDVFSRNTSLCGAILDILYRQVVVLGINNPNALCPIDFDDMMVEEGFKAQLKVC